MFRTRAARWAARVGAVALAVSVSGLLFVSAAAAETGWGFVGQ